MKISTAFAGGQYQALFMDDRWPSTRLYRQGIDGVGVLLTSTSDENIAVIAGFQNAGRPAVASGGASALAVWAMDSDIYVDLVTP